VTVAGKLIEVRLGHSDCGDTEDKKQDTVDVNIESVHPVRGSLG